MKSATFLGAILTLGILAISPTSGYESLYGRTFSLFNLLQNPQTQLKSLLSRYTILDTALSFLSSQYASLQSQITSLTSQISDLNSQIITLKKPTCPSTAPSTAKIVLGKCYQVFSNPLSFVDARLLCASGVGKLAEPTVAEAQPLWTALITVFQGETTAINTAALGAWIGVVQTPGGGNTNPFTFASNPNTNVVATPYSALTNAATLTGNAANDIVVAFLVTPNPAAATPFTAADLTATPATKGFICQY